jgi:hypothetical protein
MEKMKNLLGSWSAGNIPPPPPGGASGDSCTVFPPPSSDLSTLRQEMKDVYQGMEEFCSAMRHLDGAGTHLTESLAQVGRLITFRSSNILSLPGNDTAITQPCYRMIHVQGGEKKLVRMASGFVI